MNIFKFKWIKKATENANEYFKNRSQCLQSAEFDEISFKLLFFLSLFFAIQYTNTFNCLKLFSSKYFHFCVAILAHNFAQIHSCQRTDVWMNKKPLKCGYIKMSACQNDWKNREAHRMCYWVSSLWKCGDRIELINVGRTANRFICRIYIVNVPNSTQHCDTNTVLLLLKWRKCFDEVSHQVFLI